jgi:hypothetical protein
MEGLLRAEAAPLRRRFRESLKGDVPIVVPAVFERTYTRQLRAFSDSNRNRRGWDGSHTLWNVQNTGRLLSA